MAKKAALLVIGILLIDQLIKIWVKLSFDPSETKTVIDGFFQLHYVENPGMAFGTKFGESITAKLFLSIFRLVAITGIIFYLRKLIREGKMPKGFIYAVSLVLAGAAGNIIDSMFYDYAFTIDPNNSVYWLKDANGYWEISDNGAPVIRPTGFLLASVVDMFQFTLTWPQWVPFGLGGKEIFGAIWNFADASISIGVIWIIIRYRFFFKKEKKEEEIPTSEPAKEVEESLPQ